jgi:hypothetical protein
MSKLSYAIQQEKTRRSSPNEIVDIDVAQLVSNLRLSYEQRIQNHHNALRFVRELRNAGRFLDHAKPRQPT